MFYLSKGYLLPAKRQTFTTSLNIFYLPLHKLGGTRQFESKLSLHSLALALHKLGGTRQFESKLSLHSLALALF